jgi:hypothetical protein
MALETSIARPDLATPRRLYLTGYWDAALELLPAAVVSPGAMDAVEPVDDPAALALAAAILVDRRWWRLDQADAAEAAVGRLQASGADPALAWLLRGQLAYTRVLFDLEPGHGDTAAAEESFALAAEDPRLAGWATMWLGAMTDNLRRDPARAAVHYADAFKFARDHDDPLLESYAVRHQGAHAHALAGDHAMGVALLRRSLYLRATLGARPHVVAAQAALAEVLGPGGEADMLRETAVRTAGELGLSWLESSLERDSAG